MSAAPAGDIRTRLGRILDEQVPDQQLAALVEMVMTQTKGIWHEFVCRRCDEGQKQLVQVPDANQITASLERLLNQSKGKPVETTLVEFSAKPVEQMTLEEVRARLAAVREQRQLASGS